jgi:hypothetical protein
MLIALINKIKKIKQINTMQLTFFFFVWSYSKFIYFGYRLFAFFQIVYGHNKNYFMCLIYIESIVLYLFTSSNLLMNLS